MSGPPSPAPTIPDLLAPLTQPHLYFTPAPMLVLGTLWDMLPAYPKRVFEERTLMASCPNIGGGGVSFHVVLESTGFQGYESGIHDL